MTKEALTQESEWDNLVRLLHKVSTLADIFCVIVMMSTIFDLLCTVREWGENTGQKGDLRIDRRHKDNGIVGRERTQS